MCVSHVSNEKVNKLCSYSTKLILSLGHIQRWWKSTGLEELTFMRDRVVENYLWALGISCEPQYGYKRQMITRVVALITSIDDVYDVYGTLNELEVFTNAVERFVSVAIIFKNFIYGLSFMQVLKLNLCDVDGISMQWNNFLIICRYASLPFTTQLMK